MPVKKPSIAQMLRAPFFSSIVSPILIGTLVAVIINGSFNTISFFLVLIMGLALHGATNVYNDIYDTRQGTDTANKHRNEFSGGSGILIRHPELEGKMFLLARICLLIALLTTVAITFLIPEPLWTLLWGLYILSAFFSKYYTAAPVKLAYRGLGEISVWFAFGPMAVLVAAVSQGISFDPAVLTAMPMSGLSTLSILLIGQLIDLKADEFAGKRGVAARFGTRFTSWFYLIVQVGIILNVIYLSLQLPGPGWVIHVALVPYLILLPGALSKVTKWHDNPDKLKPAAGENVLLHLLFSGLLVAGLVFLVILNQLF